MGRLNENKISNYGICWTSGFFFFVVVVVVPPSPFSPSSPPLPRFQTFPSHGKTTSRAKAIKEKKNGEEGVKRVASAMS